MKAFRSFLALPFYCVGTLFVVTAMIFLGIGAGLYDSSDEEEVAKLPSLK